MNILEIKNLSTEYYRNKETIYALRGVTLGVRKGESLSIVGESGCGKSTLAMSILGLIQPPQGRITSGEIRFNGKNVLSNDSRQWRELRGKSISIVFQDPFSSLNPVLTIREQLTEAVAAHDASLSDERLEARAVEALEETVFADPGRILSSYPHQLSGGQRQRIMLATAIINRPEVLIADEPTTSLDVTIQKEIMDLIGELRQKLSLTVILITHNLMLAKQRSDRIAVMYAGEIVELNSARGVFENPLHPYTKALMNAVPKMLSSSPACSLSGQPPELSAVPEGCSFAPRCSSCMPECAKSRPVLGISGEAAAKCFLLAKKDNDEPA